MKEKKLKIIIVIIITAFMISLYTSYSYATDSIIEFTAPGKYNYDAALEMIKMTNEERKKVGSEPLEFDRDLSDAAMIRAAEQSFCFGHKRPNGLMWGSLVPQVFSGGENASVNYTPTGAINSWMNSPGHKANMLDPAHKTIGIGCYEFDGVYYSTQIFSVDEVENSNADGFSGVKDANVKVEVNTNLIDDLNCNLLEYKTNFKAGVDTNRNLLFRFRLKNGTIYAKPIADEYIVNVGDNSIFRVKDNTTLEAVRTGTTTITFKIGEKTKTYTITSELPFDDVKKGTWYYKAVEYVFNNNIIRGYNNTTFAPNNKLTRGMMVTILYRMEGEPEISGTPTFPDVQDRSKYYYKAVKWATDKGIISGYSNGKFGPNDNIQRQQLAVILNKYAKYKEKDVSQTSDLKEFIDSSKISS